MIRWLGPVLGVLLAAAGGCSRRSRPPATPEQALAALAQVKGEAGPLFDLIDQESRWSVMTVHRDLRKLCGLVRAHYPTGRQQRELGRCRDAEAAPEPRDFFARQAGQWGMLARLRGLTGNEPLSGSGDRRTVAGPGGQLLLCRAGAGWAYCGLRQELERLKLKTSRDVATVQENAAAFQSR